MATPAAATRPDTSTRTAIALAMATVAAWLVLALADHDGAGWILFPILGLATVVVAWRAGGASRRNTGAFAALLVGVLAVLIFLGWTIADSV